MTLYTGTIILTELMMFAMILHVATYSGFSKQQKLWFMLTFSSIMICSLSGYITTVLDGRGSVLTLLIVLNLVEFSLTPLIPVFFAGALGMHGAARRAAWLFSLNIPIEVVAATMGLIFYYDEAGVFTHGRLYFVYTAFYLASLVFMIVCLFIIGKRFNQRDISTIIMVFVVLMTAIILMILYKIYVVYIGIAIGATLSYIYYNDIVQADIQAELHAGQDRIIKMSEQITFTLANLIESRDVETGEHVVRTSEYAGLLAEDARAEGVYADVLDDNYILNLKRLAPLHDVGKIVVSDSILRKPGKLDPEEFEEMKKHAAAGGVVIREILNGIAREQVMRFASDIAMYHHERWDGKGYPEGLAGEEIPLPARIMAIADVYDALVSERCYKKAMTPEQAFEIIKEESGSHFDPKLAEVFLKHKDEFKAIVMS